MKQIVLLIGLGFVLASCGADGPPIRPTANVGVDSNGNVSTNASVGTRVGPVNVRIGL